MSSRSIYDRSNQFSGGDYSDGLAPGGSRVVLGLGTTGVVSLNNPGGATISMQRRLSGGGDPWSYIGSISTESVTHRMQLQSNMEYRWIILVAGTLPAILVIEDLPSSLRERPELVGSGSYSDGFPGTPSNISNFIAGIAQSELTLKWSLARAQAGYWSSANPICIGSNGLIYRLNPDVGGGVAGNPEVDPTVGQGTSASSWIAIGSSAATNFSTDFDNAPAPLIGTIPGSLPAGSEGGAAKTHVRYFADSIVVYVRSTDGWAEAGRRKYVDAGAFEGSDNSKGTIAPGAALPASPLAGWYINRSDTGFAERYNGTAWVAAPQHNLNRVGAGTSAQMMAADTWVNEWKNTEVDRWFDKNANGDWIQRASGHDVVEQSQVTGLTSALSAKAVMNDSVTALSSTWSSSKIAADVSAAIDNLVSDSPGAIDTINDLAATLAANPDVLATIQAVDLDGLGSDVIVGPVEPVATGTAVVNNSTYYWPESLSSTDRYVYRIETGTTVLTMLEMVVARVEQDGTLSLVSSEKIAVSAGQVFTDVKMFVPAGCVFGMRFITGGWLYTAGVIPDGGVVWYTTDLPTTSTPKFTSVANATHYKAHLRSKVFYESDAAYNVVNVIDPKLGGSDSLGWPNPVNTGSNAPSTYTIIVNNQLEQDCIITGLTVGVSASSSATVLVAEMAGNVLTIISQTPVNLTAGVNVLSLNISASAGQYVGIYGGGYRFQNSSNPESIFVWLKSGSAPASGDTLTYSSHHRFEVQFSFSWGIESRLSVLENRGISEESGPLSSVDKTGETDVTADIVAAQNTSPHVYVGPGLYQVSSIPKRGVGLWGPGKLVLSGKDYILPSSPMQGSLYEALRFRLASCIGTGSPLLVIGDSITQWAFATISSKHYVDKITAFANIEHSPSDLPIMTSFGAIASYTPAFYGVTLAGTTAGGLRGPIGDAVAGSVVLSTGATLSFTGVFESIAFSFVKEPGAGTIAVTRDATTLATINADDALELDAWSGNIATGVTSSATYTLTCSSGPVEITSLRRLGVRSTSHAKRLNVMRAARGSFVFGNYQQPEVDSMLKICNHVSASAPTVIIALGINDAATVSVASTMKTIADTLINMLKAGGVTDIIGVLPVRPSQTGSWLTRTTNFDAVVGGLVQGYRAQGVQIVAQTYDFVAAGNAPDGLHPNDVGQEVMFRTLVESLAGK